MDELRFVLIVAQALPIRRKIIWYVDGLWPWYSPASITTNADLMIQVRRNRARLGPIAVLYEYWRHGPAIADREPARQQGASDGWQAIH